MAKPRLWDRASTIIIVRFRGHYWDVQLKFISPGLSRDLTGLSVRRSHEQSVWRFRPGIHCHVWLSYGPVRLYYIFLYSYDSFNSNNFHRSLPRGAIRRKVMVFSVFFPFLPAQSRDLALVQHTHTNLLRFKIWDLAKTVPRRDEKLNCSTFYKWYGIFSTIAFVCYFEESSDFPEQFSIICGSSHMDYSIFGVVLC